MKFWTRRVSLQSSHANFQKKMFSQKMAAILNFRIFRKIAKHKMLTVNDLFSASALVTAPYLFSKQYTGQLLVGGRLDSDSVQSRLVTKG